MTLATRCPACGTAFRVVSDQLRVSSGWVRCGRCGSSFDALEHLFRHAPARKPASPAPLSEAADEQTDIPVEPLQEPHVREVAQEHPPELQTPVAEPGSEPAHPLVEDAALEIPAESPLAEPQTPSSHRSEPEEEPGDDGWHEPRRGPSPEPLPGPAREQQQQQRRKERDRQRKVQDQREAC